MTGRQHLTDIYPNSVSNLVKDDYFHYI